MDDKIFLHGNSSFKNAISGHPVAVWSIVKDRHACQESELKSNWFAWGQNGPGGLETMSQALESILRERGYDYYQTGEQVSE